MKKRKFKDNFKTILKWLSLVAFFVCSIVILAESAVHGTQSANQSNNVADIIQGGIDDNHDKETIKELNNFDIEFINQSNEYFVGDIINFKPTFDPIDTSFKNLIYEVNDDTLAEIDIMKNQISLQKAGELIITVKSERKEALTKSYTFTINNVPIESIELGCETINLNINESFQLKPTILPKNSTNKKLLFSSNNPNVATVNEDGLVTAINSGNAEILCRSTENPNINTSLNIAVNEFLIYDVSTILFPNVDLYPNKETEIQGTYGPNGSNFSFDKLDLTYDSTLDLHIENGKIVDKNNTFSLKIMFDKKINELIEIPVVLQYDNRISFTFYISINPLLPLNKDLILTPDSSSVNGSIFNNTYYEKDNNYIKEKLTLNIEFISDVMNNSYKYDTSKYLFKDVNNLFKMTKKNFKSIVIEPINNSEIVNSQIYFYPNKDNLDEYIVFHVSYVIKNDSSHIQDIEMKRLYLKEEKTNQLFINQTYDSILEFNILSNSDSKFSSIYNNTGIVIDVVEGNNLILINDNLHITTLDVGVVKLEIKSDYEIKIGIEESKIIKKEILIEITNKPNSSRVILEQNGELLAYDDLNYDLIINKDQKLYIKYELLFSPLFKTNETIINIVDLPYYWESSDNIFSYSPETNYLAALKGGKTSIVFIPYDDELSFLKKEVSLNVNHIEIDLEVFKMIFNDISSPTYNPPTKDFSKVAIETQFQVKAIVNDDATNKNIKFSSTNTSVIEIDEFTGIAYAKKQGTSIIKCYSLDDSTKSISKKIKVVNTSSPFTIDQSMLDAVEFKQINNSDGTLNHYYIALDYGRPYVLKINPIYKSTSSDLNFSFVDRQGNTQDSLITIDKSGNITTKTIGETWLKITYGGNDTINSYSCFLNIKVFRNTKLTFHQLALLVRKLFGHFGLFAITSITGMVFISLQFKKYPNKIIASLVYLVIGFALAGFSELIQLFTPGRACAWNDILLDFAGFAFTTIIFLITYLIIWFIKSKRKQK